jgi:uncharacterized protein (TIGR02270 family)
MNQIIPEVVSQHVEEAAFLWLLRDAAVHAPHYLLKDLARLDNRLEAHLDGLRVNGDPAWELCIKAAAEGDAGEVFAAAVLAFEGGRDERIDAVLKAGAATPEQARGVASALGWLPYELAAPYARKFLADPAPQVRRIGLAAAAIHRQSPHRPLAELIANADPLLRARALRAVGELGLNTHHAALRRNLKADDATSRFWAAWSSALLFGDSESIAVLQSVAEAPGPYRERAVQTAMRRMPPPGAKAWQRKLAQKPGLAWLAAIGAGVIGDPELVPWLLEQMNVPPVARVAGEAFSMITGVHLSYDKLEGEKPQGFEAGPTEDPKDENVAMDQDEHLYWPDPNAVRKWWESHKGEYSSGTRYLLGKPIGPDWLGQVLRAGYQRQRAAAALELATLEPGKPLFEVRAPGFRQVRALGKA